MESRVYTYPNATVRVHFPDISPEENERRYREIMRSAEALLRSVIIAEEKERKKQ